VVLASAGVAESRSGELISSGERRSGDQAGVLMSREATDEEASVRLALLLSMCRMLPPSRGDDMVGEP